MSYSSSVFTDIGSVFVIWFVICLFFARMLFIAILKLSREKEALTCILVAAVTITGWYIGTHVAFLPESFDVSMTAAAFIYAGYLLNKYSVWQYLKRYPLSIVLTGCIWLLQIQKDVYKRQGHHKRRLSMKPGITGMWQAYGRSTVKDFEQIVKMDLDYIDHWSLGLDMKILCHTALILFKGV